MRRDANRERRYKRTAAKRKARIPIPQIAGTILILRRHKVLLDADLAALYGVSTGRLNQQVRRNRRRFPDDFLFELSHKEHQSLMLQIATSKPGRGGRRKPPLAFTEHGAIMAATILNSPRAVRMGVYVVRAFVQLRELLSSNSQLARRFAQLEVRLDKKLAVHDKTIDAILYAIRELMSVPAPKPRGIGFTADLNR